MECEVIEGLDGGGTPKVAMGANGSAAVLLRQFDADGQDVKTVIHTSSGPGQTRAGWLSCSERA